MTKAQLSNRHPAFTLIEVLVVVSIIALLISILLPSLGRARSQARGAVCLHNLKQVGIGLTMYVLQNRDRYPKHSSPSSAIPRTRWPDYLHRNMRNTEIYRCPSLTPEQEASFLVPFAHTLNQTTGAVHNGTKYHGGYGYNFQYLGNARTLVPGPGDPPEWSEPFHAPASNIRMPAVTLAIADVRGSRKNNPNNMFGQGGAATYSIDPPLGSLDLGSRGSRKSAAQNWWYEGGNDLSQEELIRSAPDRRHSQKANVTFCDGHAGPMDVDVLDGRESGANPDNRYYNGLFDSTRR